MSRNILHQLWHYNDLANTRLLDGFEKNGEVVPASSLRLLSHIMNAQAVWLSRIKGEPQPVSVWAEHNLVTCRQMHTAASIGLGEVVDQYGADPQHPVSYVNSRGEAFQNSVLDILLQVFNHGTYHRGQIAMDFRQHGLEPVFTDYIGFVR
jgi:uncharacterized damage-inducible protein DinB